MEPPVTEQTDYSHVIMQDYDVWFPARGGMEMGVRDDPERED